MAYDLIENDQIVESVNALPHGWRNVSGLNLLSAEELAAIGWLPRTETRAPLGPFQRHGEPAKIVHPDRTEWVYPAEDVPLPEAAAATIADLAAACEAAITAGFDSAALGAPHRYDGDRDAQLNLTGAALIGTDVPYTCTDAAGVKVARLHTPEQMRRVLADGAAFKLAALARFRELKNAARAAATRDELSALTWDSQPGAGP